MKRKISVYITAFVIGVTLIANTVPVSAASNSRTATLPSSMGKMTNSINVGAYNWNILMMDYYFDASASSSITTMKAVKEHILSLKLWKDGLQGSLTAGASSSGGSAGVSVSQNSSTVATYTTPKSTSKTRAIVTYNNYIHRTIFDVVVPLILVPGLANVFAYFTVTGSANSQAVIGGKTCSNTCATTQYW